MHMTQGASCCVTRRRKTEQVMLPGGRFHVRHERNGILLAEFDVKNDFTTAGKNYMLDCMFGAATPVAQVDPWYIGLINNSPTPTLLLADTLASHTGWAEFSSYTGNRQEWDDADAASGVKATDAVSTFPITASGSIYGIFLASVATGTSGVLWSTASYDDAVAVSNGDDLKVSYSLGL